jgi:hypothetical protein
MLSMLKMMEKKIVQRNHVSFIYHIVDGLFDDIELQMVSKRRIDVEPLLPPLLSSCMRMNPLQPQGSVSRGCPIAITRGYTH